MKKITICCLKLDGEKMLEVGDICPDWNFVGPLNEHINISMPPIAGRFSILIVYHSKNSVLETVFLKISDTSSHILKKFLEIRVKIYPKIKQKACSYFK